MKRYFYLTLFLTLSVNAEKLSIERIYSSPSLSGDPIRELQISPDGKRVTFLKGKSTDFERLDLWQYDIASGATTVLFDSDDLHSGEEILSDEEKARRERMRLKGSGIVSYEWSKDGTALLFPLAGDIYYYKLGGDRAKKIVETDAFETDVKFSPKGNYVSYVREQNLFIYHLASNTETQLTHDGKGPIKYAMAEFVAQEEMGRMTGYWWSHDESKIALTRVDESPVEEVVRTEIYADDIKFIKQRYPFAGKNNVDIDLGIIQLSDKDKKVVWVDLGKNNDIYLPRVKWTRDSTRLTFQIQSRDQQKLALKMVEWPSLKQSTLLREKSKTWINLHDDLYFLKDGERFIWASEKSGFKHLYLYALTGKKRKQLTSGNWVVDELEGVDEENDLVYFTGRKDSVLERHLYSVSLKSGEIEKITQRPGFHTIDFADDHQRYIDEFSTNTTPPQVSLHRSTGERMMWLAENAVDKNHPLFPFVDNWISPEFSSIQSEDNDTLFYRLYKPANFDPAMKFPVIVFVYGGPHVQLVANRWSKRDLLLQHLAQQGYAIFTLDNRGSSYRGKAFEEPIYKSMGAVEIDDQIEGVKFLHTLPWVDKDKVGIHGHSYGGYMTLMAMFKAPEFFKVGVAGAPVTDWLLYDTHYTERYMGNPVTDLKAYEKASVFPYATNLQGALLIYHGMADDNVLFKNSTKLYKVLQDNNLQFMVMDYPGKKHSIRGKTTEMHRATMIRNFFDLHFGIKR